MIHRVVGLILLAMLVMPGTSAADLLDAVPQRLPGQTATLLPDGRWFLLGGWGPAGPVAEGAVWDARTQTMSALTQQLLTPRAWHTASVLPDGTVLIIGGVGANGGAIASVEQFDPSTGSFARIESLVGHPRASHTATVLTDGHVLVVGGVGSDGAALGDAELWNPRAQTLITLPSRLTTGRSGHEAVLLPDGTVILWGGFSDNGLALSDGEVYDPNEQRFALIATRSSESEAASDPLSVAASDPPDGSSDVPVDVVLALRFSEPLRVETVNAATVLLSSPNGVEAATVVAAEAGRLAFITPEAPLAAGTTYRLSINGVTDQEGQLLPLTGIRFTTRAGNSTSGPAAKGAPKDIGVGPTDGASNGEDWAPASLTNWRTGLPQSRWTALPHLQAPAGVTAISGQVLKLNGEPLADVTLRIEEAAARTDDTGRFLLTGVVPGVYALVIDGGSASQPGRRYGRFEANIELVAGQTVALPYTIWMPKLDTAHAVRVPAYTTNEVVVTTPRIPGLELRIPAHSAIRDESGAAVTEVTITPIPLDRPPFPLPEGVDVPLYFTIQPSGAYISSRYASGARLVYPNTRQARAGTRYEFWDYEAERKGWYIYGVGSVTQDGQQVAAPPAVSIYEFTGAMVAPPANAPGQAPPPEAPPPQAPPPPQGDPVDPATGLFVYSKTDLALTDTLALALTRTYRPQDPQSRPFGIGATHPYEMWLVGNQLPWTWADLVLPDGGRVHYERISAGIWYTDAVYEHTATPGRFYKSVITWNGNGWDVRLKDGTVYVIGNVAPLRAIRDRYGNTITVSRASTNSYGSPIGNITRVTSPNGRFIDFTYDAANRITQAMDNIGRTVTYAYDASGRLTSATDPAGGVTQYTYDASHRMLTIRDPRNIVFLTNEYDTSDRVTRQTLADGTTYLFAYTIDGGTGKIVQTDTTNPRGFVRRLTLNSAGYPLTDTRALGTVVAQTTTYVRQAGSNLVTSTTDVLGRRTDYTYDGLGNMLTVTRLAGTADAVTTTLTYEPTFNQVASRTTPLGQTTTFTYNATGSLTTITNPLGHQTTLTYDAGGRPLTITTPAGTSTLTYDAGDLVGITDPAGNATGRFLDAVGRLVSVTNPLGRRTRYNYDALNRLTRVTDALTGLTQFGYDANGNLLSVTDARGGVTGYTYDSLDRLVTRTDPVLRAESSAYDNEGNLTTFTDRKSQVTNLTYDALGRLTQRAYADGSTTSYTWDAGNRLAQLVDSLSGTITRTYDGLDRLTQEVTPQGTVGYTYDAAGRRISMTVAGQPSVSYAYDTADRLTSITQGSSVVSFTYDAAARRTSLTLPNGVITDYVYDAASRLTGLTYRNGATTLGTLTYAYDLSGHRRQVGGTWARTGLPQAVASATYDAANRQLTFGSQTLTYDFNGNLTSDGANSYTWNARGELVGVNGAVASSFNYDAVGRRWRKTISGVATDALYDMVNPVQELSAGSTVNLLVSLGIDEYLTRIDVTGTRTLLADALGSTVAVTNSAGAVEAEYTYEPFGATAVTGTPVGNPFQYTGRENDGTGLDYYRARYYHPSLQRFISEDPIGLRGGVNAYLYVNNNPLTYVDPFGLWTLHLGINMSFTTGSGITIGGFAGIAIDGHGNVGSYSGLAGGLGAGAGVSGGFSVAGSTGDTIVDLGGPFGNASITAGAGAAGSFDTFWGRGSQGQSVTGAGITFGVGAGAAASVGGSITGVVPWFKIHRR